FFREKVVAVVGGGDSAMEEATFLTKFASKVVVIHRSENLRASEIMQERAKANPKIEFLYNTVVESLTGGDKLTTLNLRSTLPESASTLEVDGLFVANGSDPRTPLVHGTLDLNPDGTVWVDGRSSRTSVAGVFAAGEVL